MQPAVSVHAAYFRGIRSTGLEPRPRPGCGFKATSRPRAAKNRAPEQGAKPPRICVATRFSQFAIANQGPVCRHDPLLYEIILPFLSRASSGRRQLINSHQTGTRVSILFFVLAICNPYACRIPVGSGPLIVSDLAIRATILFNRCNFNPPLLLPRIYTGFINSP